MQTTSIIFLDSLQGTVAADKLFSIRLFSSLRLLSANSLKTLSTTLSWETKRLS